MIRKLSLLIVLGVLGYLLADLWTVFVSVHFYFDGDYSRVRWVWE